MSERDRRLAATKYAGKTSATQQSRDRQASRSRVPDGAGGSVVDALKAFDITNPKPIARDQASIDRAAAHKRNLPPLG